MPGAAAEPNAARSPTPPPAPPPQPPRPLPRLFAQIGYAVVSLIVIGGVLELLAFAGWKIRAAIHPDPNDTNWQRSPGLSSQPWGPAFVAEERDATPQMGSYVPYRIWGPLPRSSKFHNTEATPLGWRRRTINTLGADCAGRTPEQIWMFGGSTTYGAGTPDWTTVPSWLSAILNGEKDRCVEIINFGVEGYISTQELLLLEEALKRGGRPAEVIFYDGFNDAYVGVVNPGDPFAHATLDRIKRGMENRARNKLAFLDDSYAVKLTRVVIDHFRRKHRGAAESAPAAEPRVAETLANYEANLATARLLAGAYHFQVHAFWQPFLFYGEKRLHPFEAGLVRWRNESNGTDWGSRQARVYAAAEARAASTGAFVFLGHLFDGVTDALYIDGWMHLSPEGNRLVAAAIARTLTAEPAAR
ncbi:MAG TPA: SGNH/GDSL hydrolase family protein [Polyangia bacterium]